MTNFLWSRMLFRNSDWLDSEMATCPDLCIAMIMSGSALSLLWLPCFDMQPDYCMGTTQAKNKSLVEANLKQWEMSMDQCAAVTRSKQGGRC